MVPRAEGAFASPALSQEHGQLLPNTAGGVGLGLHPGEEAELRRGQMPPAPALLQTQAPIAKDSLSACDSDATKSTLATRPWDGPERGWGKGKGPVPRMLGLGGPSVSEGRACT